MLSSHSRRRSCLSLFPDKNKLGISAFRIDDADSDWITCSQFTQAHANDYSVLERILELGHPDEVLLPQSAPERLRIHVKDTLEARSGTGEEKGKDFAVRMLKTKDYDLETAMNYLLMLGFPFTGEAEPEIEIKKRAFITTSLDFSNTAMHRALGALVIYLINNREILPQEFPLGNIKMNMQTVMKPVYVNRKTMNSLQIFTEDVHPSLIKGKGRSKEGFSVFTLFENQAQTTQGKKFLKKVFLSPTFDKEVLENRLNTVENLMRLVPGADLFTIRKELAKLSDIETVMRRFTEARCTLEDWKKLKNYCVFGPKLLGFLQKIIGPSTSVPFLQALSEFSCKDLTNLGVLLERCVEFHESSISIARGVNLELDSLRKLYDNLEDLLDLWASKELETVQQCSNIKQFAMTFVPQLGYLIVTEPGPEEPIASQEMSQRVGEGKNLFDIPEESEDDVEANERRSPSGCHDYEPPQGLPEGWCFQFQMNKKFFFKNQFTAELDEKYGDVSGKITDLEQAILRQLEEQIVDLSSSLSEFNCLVAELDCFISFVCVAIEYRFCRPLLSFQSILIVKEGRHPLSELSSESGFVSNDFFVYNFVDEFDHDFQSPEGCLIDKRFSNRCCLMTGPNYSGKSVFLKQIGIIVFLAHIGSFVPAKFCKLGLFDRILSCINLSESLSYQEGGLLEEQRLLSTALNLATPRSLLLIDEYAKNASQFDALALVGSLLEYVCAPKFPNSELQETEAQELKGEKLLYNKVPTTLIVTHLRELISLNLVAENYFLRFLTMKTASIDRPEGQPQNSDQKIVYLRKMTPGICNDSLAIELACEILKDDFTSKRAKAIKARGAGGAEALGVIESNYFLRAKSLMTDLKRTLGGVD